MEIFISYSSHDKQSAQDLAKQLRAAGFNVWRDQEGISPGGQFPLALQQALLRCDIVLYLNTQVATQSEWVNNEINFALAHKKPIIPVLLEADVKLPLAIFTRQGIDFYTDWNAGYTRLVGYLQEVANKHKDVASTSELEQVVFEPKTTLPTTVASVPDVPEDAQDPFWFGGAIPEQLFVGREDALKRIRTAIVGRFNKVRSVSIVGNRRIGKTSLLNYIVKRHSYFLPPNCERVFIYVDMMDARAREIPDFMRILRRGIARQVNREPWAETHDGSISRLSDAIEELADNGTPLVLCLDEWETVMAFPELERLLETLRSQGSKENLSMVIASADSLFDLTTNAQIGSPFYNIFEEVPIGLLPKVEWSKAVENAFTSSGEAIAWSEASAMLDNIERLTGGHPYLVQLAGSLFWRGKQANWTLDQVEQAYLQQARTLFSWTLQRLKMEHVQALQAAIGLIPRQNIPVNAWLEATHRGLLRDDQPFCEPFARFVREEMR